MNAALVVSAAFVFFRDIGIGNRGEGGCGFVGAGGVESRGDTPIPVSSTGQALTFPPSSGNGLWVGGERSAAGRDE